MTISVNIAEAKAQLSYLLARAKAGEEVIICNRNEPDAYLLPIIKNDAQPLRPIGLAKGQFEIPDGCFEHMAEEELALWYDAPLVNDPIPDKP
jgi:prevent-host-death family protein